jgi:hypothetical protein
MKACRRSIPWTCFFSWPIFRLFLYLRLYECSVEWWNDSYIVDWKGFARWRSCSDRDTILKQDIRYLRRDLDLLPTEYRLRSLTVDQSVQCCFTCLLSFFLHSFFLYFPILFIYFYLFIHLFLFLFSNLSLFFHLPDIFFRNYTFLTFSRILFTRVVSFSCTLSPFLLSRLFHYRAHHYQPKKK